MLVINRNYEKRWVALAGVLEKMEPYNSQFEMSYRERRSLCLREDRYRERPEDVDGRSDTVRRRLKVTDSKKL